MSDTASPPVAIPQRYSAEDEIHFLRDLAARRPLWCIGYCTLILRDLRRWDPTVKVDRVRAECERLLVELDGVGDE